MIHGTCPIGWVAATRQVFDSFPPTVRNRISTHTHDRGWEGNCAMTESNFDLVEGSGNVFRDLGDSQADLKQAKAVLAASIVGILDDRGCRCAKPMR